jgi:hypothetical protein
MSSINKKINSTKYCKVCQDAGKTESEYRSHFTRESKDPNSKVCCPTLLALECRYCFKSGHTIKYCKILKDNQKNKKKWEEEAKNKKDVIEKSINNTTEKKILSNKFAYLEDEDSENELEEHISNNNNIVEDFPQLSSVSNANISIVSSTPSGINYATALTNKSAMPLPASIPVRMPPLNKKKVSICEMNWAAMESDSEEEDDYDNYDAIQDCYNNYDNKECYQEDW